MDDPGLRLSVVATSRNDDHGANLRRRMQTFVTAFINQCKRHDLRAELILVEWNPPADRPRLAQALNWPADPAPCEVRIIEVPEALHRRFKFSEALPLFQMIAKNVGIRRARGQFILATNIDIIFNDELIQFLKNGRLEKGKIYRIDRTDVETDVPAEGSIEEQLAYCRSHHVRLNAAGGTFPLTPEGIRLVEPLDVTSPESQLVIMDGGSFVERTPDGQPFRWAGGDVDLQVTAPPGRPCRLLAELSPGPCVRRLPAEIEIRDGGTVVARGKLLGRSVVALSLPLAPGQCKVFRLRAVEGDYFPAPGSDCRVLDFAIHRLSWSDDGPARLAGSPEEAFQIVAAGVAERGDIVAPRSGIRLDLGWHMLQRRAKTKYRAGDSGAALLVERRAGSDLHLKLWVGAGSHCQEDRNTFQVRDEKGHALAAIPLAPGPRPVSVPAPGGDSCRLFMEVLENGIPVAGGRGVRAFRLFSCHWSDAPFSERLAAAAQARAVGLALWSCRAADKVRRLLGGGPRMIPDDRGRERPYRAPRLHTNACGDFTLLARDDWFELGAYAELEIFSLHIDSLFLYAAHYAGLQEVVLPPVMRAYHIEHSTGSGWTPEGQKRLLQRMRSKGIPVLDEDDLCRMAHDLMTERNPRLYSGSQNWGLAGETLPEVRIGAAGRTLAA